MKLGFGEWKLMPQASVGLSLDPTKLYYLHARAWHFKGYIGGTHSWITFYSRLHDDWLVVELTDRETLGVQDCTILFSGTDQAVHAPFITNRVKDAQWFGTIPRVVDCCLTRNFEDFQSACLEYPIREFRLATRNCNTFTSYLIWRLELNLERPLRSIGFKNKKWWDRKYGT